MDMTVTTKPLSHPDYVLHVVRRDADDSYIGKIILSRQNPETGPAGTSSSLDRKHDSAADQKRDSAAGETLFISFPQATVEEAEKAAHEYYIQLNKPKP
ncbi:hypothetical protein [Paenibacillus senegalensis]|uniref:hypothetical protein n=1 Tax=Paenibacillus senegalensis TaxID=1465766 RepID=UPI0002889FDA|nr:hypothetical protein [Paenibacillus senegalensis]